MLQADDAIDDLIVLARRGDLPDTDERRLRERLASATLDRELYEAGRAFDAEGPVQDDDADRIDRLVRDVDRRVHASRRSPVRRWAPRALIAAMLMTGATVGAVRLANREEAPAPAPRADDAAPPPPAPAIRTSAPRHAAPAPEIEIVAEPLPLPPVPPVPQTRPAPRPPAPAAAKPMSIETSVAAIPEVAPPEPTASELFASANAARVRQDLAEAIRLSKQLMARYPESPQAITTRLSLGLMYLQLGQPALALDELQAAPASPEALWSKSRALHDLGRTADERAALEDLLARYPRSAYTSAATKRLEALR